MIYRTYESITSGKKPGDEVFAVRINAYDGIPADQWPDVKPVRGTLQSSYFDNPSRGPWPPRHLMPAEPDRENAWDGPWWDLEHWIVCDTMEEARAELKKQAEDLVKKLEAELTAMRAIVEIL